MVNSRTEEGLRAFEILGIFVNHLDYEEARDRIIKLALNKKSSYVFMRNCLILMSGPTRV